MTCNITDFGLMDVGSRPWETYQYDWSTSRLVHSLSIVGFMSTIGLSISKIVQIALEVVVLFLLLSS